MYSKEEAFQIRKKFWISFGQYMKLQSSASGLEVNWINYKTGIKGLQLKTDVDNKSARIAIEINHPDREIQELMMDQFEEFQALFESELGADWTWYRSYFELSGKHISKIELRLENVSIFKEEDWPAIISFLKNNLLSWDSFWEDVKDSFEIFK
ncbi:DUF4268 domain-containing protein [Moheibacter lacus]|uniref:DUF4268 domain-containing protein n=1 Tax=Moheibacter lacus TaxID=2745851 RepID=A0A838ZT64_9FLAO|nr:DUF4268 domain-containing protein [Moheibacter lacus]MBA5630171.1 DUF4268 domain-containing protein [Moheibacter lacus]